MFAPLYKPLSGFSEWSDPHHEAVQPARCSSHELGAKIRLLFESSKFSLSYIWNIPWI